MVSLLTLTHLWFASSFSTCFCLGFLVSACWLLLARLRPLTLGGSISLIMLAQVCLAFLQVLAQALIVSRGLNLLCYFLRGQLLLFLCCDVQSFRRFASFLFLVFLLSATWVAVNWLFFPFIAHCATHAILLPFSCPAFSPFLSQQRSFVFFLWRSSFSSSWWSSWHDEDPCRSCSASDDFLGSNSLSPYFAGYFSGELLEVLDRRYVTCCVFSLSGSLVCISLRSSFFPSLYSLSIPTMQACAMSTGREGGLCARPCCVHLPFVLSRALWSLSHFPCFPLPFPSAMYFYWPGFFLSYWQ